jgi:hypothetical protein
MSCHLGDARKAALAAAIRSGTAVSNRWIAETLHLGHVSRVSHCTRTAQPELVKQLTARSGQTERDYEADPYSFRT